MPLYLAIVIVIAAGLAAALQPAINTALAGYTGPIMASTISFCSGSLILIAWLLLAVGRTGVAQGFNALWGRPLWLLTGGALGVVIVTAVIYAVPVMGVGTTSGLLVATQLTASLLVDHYGIAGAPHASVTWIRVLGAVLVIVGARLIFLRPGG